MVCYSFLICEFAETLSCVVLAQCGTQVQSVGVRISREPAWATSYAGTVSLW